VLWQRALAAAMVAILKTESHTWGMKVAHHGGESANLEEAT